MKNKILYIVTGIPGAGKTTFLKPLSENIVDNVGVVSRDEIRFSLVKEDEEYFSKENEVFKTFVYKIEEMFNYKDIVIADATHINENSRAKLMKALSLPVGCEIYSLTFDVPVGTCIAQNKKRMGTRSYVPEDVIRKMGNKMTIPKYKEGFDKIYLYNSYYGVKELEK